MKLFFSLQIFLILVFTALAWLLVDKVQTVSFFGGALLALFNVVFLSLVARRVFSKKSVATTLFLIILKYSVLGFVLYSVVVHSSLDLMWFVFGLSTLLPSTIAYVLLLKKHSQEWGN